jgi:hypothetical protein
VSDRERATHRILKKLVTKSPKELRDNHQQSGFFMRNGNLQNRMHVPSFSIVVPTRNRADVLRSAITTAVSQDDSALQIIISDNASDDDTRAVVQSFADARVRYVNPGRTLGMAEHWEFALSHVTGDYATVLGDDDGLLPDAVKRARDIMERHGVQAVAWRKAEYHWPDHIVPSFRNWLQVPFGDETVLETTSVLREVLAFKRTYTDLPCIYNSFVATEILHTLRMRTNGHLLPCVTPDIYSGMAIASVIDHYAFSGLPLSVNAASRHSNGTLASFRGVNTPGTAEHYSSTAQQVHPRLVRSSSVPVLIADAALTVRDRLTRADGWPALDWAAMFNLAARYAERRPPDVLAETLGGLDEIARRNGLLDLWKPIRATVSQGGLPELQPPGWDAEGAHLAVDGAKLGIRNVADAACFTAAALSATGATDPQYVPAGLDEKQRSAWTDFVLALERPSAPPAPPAEKPPTRLQRYWRRVRHGVRRRFE